MSDKSIIVGYAGMTHLGLNSAVAAAERGFSMVCYDPDATRIDELAAGKLPVVEPDLPEMLARNAARIRFTSDAKALAACDVVYVAPDVPTDDVGGSDLAPLTALIEAVDRALSANGILVILSQVPPGFTRQLAPRLTRRSDQLFYQVETLIFGRAVDRALNPERFILGCADPAQALPAPFKAFLDAFVCPLLPMRYESAELAKISINCCLVASVSVANTLAELCERIGADWSEIAPSLKLDKRIGPYSYLAPGLGISGGNLERDLATVVRMADEQGTDAGVVRAWIANSRYRKDWPLRTLHREVLDSNPDAKIAVLGLAYKEDTHSIKNSPSLALIEQLAPYALTVHDPVVPASAAPHPAAQGAATPLDACQDADALLIMTPWKQFRSLTPAAVAAAMRGNIVIDPFRILDPAAARAAGLHHITLGVPA
ncbi:MAG: nucleotide sugar dehydrogenase [Alphaproteobacteria bacterium]